jgi:hypothetical protein
MEGRGAGCNGTMGEGSSKNEEHELHWDEEHELQQNESMDFSRMKARTPAEMKGTGFSPYINAAILRGFSP